MFKVWGHPIFIRSSFYCVSYIKFKLLRLDNSGFDLDQPFSNQFSPWTVAPHWPRMKMINDLEPPMTFIIAIFIMVMIFFCYQILGVSSPLSQPHKSVRIVFHQTSINLCPWLPVSLTSPDWCDMNLGSSKWQEWGPTHNRSLSSSHPAAFTTTFKTRTHQLMCRMAERKSFFWVGDDSCVFISGCLHRLCFTPPRVCLLVKRVTQQPGAQGGCQNFKDVKLRVSFISIWICIISLTYSNSNIS